jgi:hypothetical protein
MSVIFIFSEVAAVISPRFSGTAAHRSGMMPPGWRGSLAEDFCLTGEAAWSRRSLVYRRPNPPGIWQERQLGPIRTFNETSRQIPHQTMRESWLTRAFSNSEGQDLLFVSGSFAPAAVKMGWLLLISVPAFERVIRSSGCFPDQMSQEPLQIPAFRLTQRR